jgi:hypothetical protein
MRRTTIALFSLLLAVLILLPRSLAAETPAHPAKPAVAAQFAKLPLSFEPNVGQTDPRVTFLSHGSGYTLALSPTAATLVLTHATPPAGPPKFQAPSKPLDSKSLVPKATT